MPYTAASLADDERFKGLPAHAREIFASAFNAALEEYHDEEKAFAVAWAAVKQKYRKDGDKWVAKMSADRADVTEEPTGPGGAETIADAGTVLLSSDAEPLVVREAKLFEAGAYADKGLEITEADLDRLIASTNRRAADGDPVPVMAGHDSPLRFGNVVECWRRGKELFAKLAFGAAHWAHVQADNACKISVGLRRDKSGLDHVGLVIQPRIADAQVFASFAQETELVVVGDATDKHNATETEAVEMSEDTKDQTTTTTPAPAPVIPAALPEDVAKAMKTLADFSAIEGAAEKIAVFAAAQNAATQRSIDAVLKTSKAVDAVTARLQQLEAESAVARFKGEGRCTPAMEPFLRALLAAAPIQGAEASPDTLVTFTKDDQTAQVHFSQVVIGLLQAMPVIVNFAEIAKAGETETIAEETLEVGRKLGVDAETIRKYKDR